MKKKTIAITIVTLFPEFIEQYASFGIVARAIKNKIVKFSAVQLRSFGIDKRGTVDDRPYGGGLGMVLRPDVVIKAITKVRTKFKNKKTHVVLLTPQGKRFTQGLARKLATYDHLVFVSGRYEGFDERVRKFVDEELSVGDYVLMGGELPSLVMSEAVLRLIPGVLGKDDSADRESFTESMLEYPQYTKPEVLEVNGKKLRVPKVLLTGHHANVNAWRTEEALKRTKKRRPDLLNE
jgi:tRNA (guanine37-N1)-methyltransferase